MLKGILQYNLAEISYHNKTFLSSFSIQYFNVYSSPFETDSSPHLPKKKLRIDEKIQFNEVDVVLACYQFLQSSVDFYRRKWDWSVFIRKYLQHTNVTIKW